MAEPLREFTRSFDECTGCTNKKQSPRKTSVYQQWQYEFEPTIRTLYKSIHTTYPANFIKSADMVQQIQQFYFKVHFFKWTWCRVLNIHESNFAQLFVNSSNVLVMIVSSPLGI